MDRQRHVVPFALLTSHGIQPTVATTEHPSRLLDDADIVYAINGQDNRDILIFGREKLRRIAASDVPEGARVFRVRVCSESGELERLLELVQQRKGRHDYAESA
jgi:hypothetical protein